MLSIRRSGTIVASCVLTLIPAVAFGQPCTGWEQAGSAGPSIRSSHALSFDSARQRVVLFGGYGLKPDGSEYEGDTWEFDGVNWSRRATAGPAARQNPGMVFDSFRGRTVLFGGFAHSNGVGPVYYGQTWEWDGLNWTNRATTGPSGRFLHAMAYDAENHRTVLFGGLADGSFRDTATWTWDGTNWAQVSTTGPAPRFGHAMAYDSVRRRVVLFGGFGGTGTDKELLHDTWEWNGTTWILVSTVGPAARQHHSMAFDASRGKVVLIGGRLIDGAAANDLWEWTGTQWQLIESNGPGAREAAGLSFHSGRQSLVLFGGFGDRGRFGDTWQRTIGSGFPIFTQSPVDVVSPPGSTATLSAQAIGDGALSYQWRRNQVALTNNGRITGATSPTLVIRNVSASDDGLYQVVVTNACGSGSAGARITVRCPADIDNGTLTGVRDGAVNINDLVAFMSYFEGGNIGADVDNGTLTGTPDQGVDISDFIYFLSRFELGC